MYPRLKNFTRSAAACTALATLGIPAWTQAVDTPYLAGIHWYHSDTSNGDVEALTGGRAAWVVDQALLDSNATIAAGNVWETPWITSPAINKTQPYYKANYTAAVIAKGHTAIMRLHPYWGVNAPYPGDPYAIFQFADDCKAAAALMQNVHIWQIGNEANLNGENMRWNSASNRYDMPWPDPSLAQAPELYAATYVACRDKIHEVTPQTTPATQIVLMQPCSPGAPIPGTRFMSSDEFLARMIAAVPDKSKIDGFALHAYAQPGGADFGAASYMDDLRRQIAIIDQAGLGDRPIFITEFNKHMPNATEAAIGAKFIASAFSRMHNWNSGAPALWPDMPNHPLRGTAWFVYRGGAGWDDYSLQHWKSASASTATDTNPWYAFQAACAQAYPAGTGVGPSFTPESQWWNDTFSGSSIDTAFPLPAWEVVQGSGSTVGVQSGAARIVSTSSFQLAGFRKSSIPFTDFTLDLDLQITDGSPIASGEANVDIRIRQVGQGGPGLSLTLYSNSSSVRPGQVWLRKTAFWDTSYKSGSVAGGIASGDRFTVQIRATGPKIAIQLRRMPDNQVVLDWTGANASQVPEFIVGGIGFYTYNLREAAIDNIAMGGTEMVTAPSEVLEWSLYD